MLRYSMKGCRTQASEMGGVHLRGQVKVQVQFVCRSLNLDSAPERLARPFSNSLVPGTNPLSPLQHLLAFLGRLDPVRKGQSPSSLTA